MALPVELTVLRGERVTLRPFHLDDVALIDRWAPDAEAVRLFAGPGLGWPVPAEALAPDEADGCAWTIETPDGTAVGHVQLRGIAAGESARIARLLLAPEARGADLGADTIRTLIAAAREILGVRTVSLNVFPENTRAIRLYDRLGFRPAGPSTVPGAGVSMTLATPRHG